MSSSAPAADEAVAAKGKASKGGKAGKQSHVAPKVRSNAMLPVVIPLPPPPPPTSRRPLPPPPPPPPPAPPLRTSPATLRCCSRIWQSAVRACM